MPTVGVFHMIQLLPQFGSGFDPIPEPFMHVGTVLVGWNGC